MEEWNKVSKWYWRGGRWNELHEDLSMSNNDSMWVGAGNDKAIRMSTYIKYTETMKCFAYWQQV